MFYYLTTIIGVQALLLSVHSDDKLDKPNNVIKTVKGLAKKVDSSCCYLLHTNEMGMKDRNKIWQAAYQFASDFDVDLSVTSLTFRQFLELYRRQRDFLDCKSPINVIFHGDEETRREFSFISWSLPMHDFTWFIFNHLSIEDFFQNVSTPFSGFILAANKVNEDYIKLSEVYRVAPSKPLRSPEVGYWSLDDGFVIHPDVSNVYNRRHDFEGLVLRTGSTQNAPIHSFEISPLSGELELVGYFPEVWKELEIILNFTSVHYPSVDNFTGIRENNDTWNGLIGMLQRNEIDVAVSEFIMEKQRTHVVDFTIPLVKTSYQIFFKSAGANYNWDAILRPFQTETWVAIFGWLIFASISMFFIHNKCYSLALEPQSNLDDFSMINSIFFHIKAICCQGHTVVPKTLSCRILYLCAYLVTCILVPSYSAYLISYLTFRTPRRPFDDLHGLLNDGTYKLQTNAKTAEYTYFSEASDPTLQRIYRELMVKIPTDEFPLNTQEALDRVCRDPHLAHFGDMIVAYSYLQTMKAQKQCDIVTLSQSISTIYSSMALRRHSHFRMVINHYLKRMEDHGLIKRAMQITFPVEKTSSSSGDNVDLRDVALTFILLTGGALLAFIFFLMELSHWWWFGSRRLQYPQTLFHQKSDKFSKNSQPQIVQFVN